jgi:hypothetical protein
MAWLCEGEKKVRPSAGHGGTIKLHECERRQKQFIWVKSSLICGEK